MQLLSDQIKEFRGLRNLGQHEQVCDLAKQIIADDSSSPANKSDAWWNLALSQHSLKNLDEAVESLKALLKLSPKSVYGWSQYGVILAEKGHPDQGLKALSQALQIDSQYDFAARQAARICREGKDHSAEIHYLTLLDAMGKADANDLNRLGIAYWKKNHFGKAIETYQRSAAKSKDYAQYFNLALVYAHKDVSQDVDAIDCLERSLRLNPTAEKTKSRIQAIKPKLETLAQTVLSSNQSALPKENWYTFYINPFELLVGIDQVYQFESFDAKTIKGLKNKLFQEIELEDGSIHYVDNLKIDKSKAIDICEDLNDESLKRCHWLVFKEPRLLSFLSRGDIHHFLCLEDYKPLDLLDEIDSEGSEFKKWLSPIFAKQYELVLTRALKNRCVPLIESLFDGRRWVLPEHEEICFEGAKRQVDSLIEPLRRLAEQAKDLPPTMAGLEAVLQSGQLTSTINLLPETFREQQNEVVSLVRSIAIKAFNEHGNADLSHSILKLSKKFNFKSASLKQSLEEDFKQIEKNIAEERKHEMKLTRGGSAWQITKEGARKGTDFIPADTVASIRWGIVISGTQHLPIFRSLMVCRDNNGNSIKFSWENLSDSLPLVWYQQTFDGFVNAALNYIVPNICDNISKILAEGKAVKIGPCSLTTENIQFEMPGWFKSKQLILPWTQVELKTQNGNLLVYDRNNPKVHTEVDIMSTENAVVLRFFAHLFGKK
jgi:tetratricopeptide (TPR) repeat protein